MKTKEEIEKLKLEIYRNIKDGVGGDFGFFSVGFDFGYTQCQEDILKNQDVTRFEVIDENGRVYSKWNCKVELSYQDDGKTLKVFIKPLDKQDNESK